jgi:DNA-binding SARP family transcriptional activator
VDELAEELYRRLIMCYQRLDRKAEALSVYNRCKKTLSSALGIEPSPETQALYQKILTENR